MLFFGVVFFLLSEIPDEEKKSEKVKKEWDMN
jgi:hypothetical protein